MTEELGEEITVNTELLHAPHVMSPDYMISWMESLKARHYPTTQYPEPIVRIADCGLSVLWTERAA